MFDINEIKKDLYGSKNMAKFSHYISGNLYYTVELENGNHQFLIETIEKDWIEPDMNDIGDEREVLILSPDLGSTSFEKEMKGSELIRWIQKSINSGDFIKVS